MIITTPGKPSSKVVQQAKKLSNTYQIPYQERLGVSIQTLKDKYQKDIIIVGSDRITISPLHSDGDLFFHPNLAFIRAKRLLKGEEDPFITTGKIREGITLLDCTLGLASDSIIASLIVGDGGKVTGIEGNKLVYLLVRNGLLTFKSGYEKIDNAMRRINVVHQDHLSFLQEAESESFDIVYFDPMFDDAIDSSHGINVIRNEAIRTDITEEVIEEAKRVARERVILKDHWKSDRFTKLGFKQYKRKTSLFHYGIIEKD